MPAPGATHADDPALLRWQRLMCALLGQCRTARARRAGDFVALLLAVASARRNELQTVAVVACSPGPVWQRLSDLLRAFVTNRPKIYYRCAALPALPGLFSRHARGLSAGAVGSSACIMHRTSGAHACIAQSAAGADTRARSLRQAPQGAGTGRLAAAARGGAGRRVPPGRLDGPPRGRRTGRRPPQWPGPVLRAPAALVRPRQHRRGDDRRRGALGRSPAPFPSPSAIGWLAAAGRAAASGRTGRSSARCALAYAGPGAVHASAPLHASLCGLSAIPKADTRARRLRRRSRASTTRRPRRRRSPTRRSPGSRMSPLAPRRARCA